MVKYLSFLARIILLEVFSYVRKLFDVMKTAINWPEPGRRARLWLVFIIPAACSTNHSSSRVSLNSQCVIDRRKGAATGLLGVYGSLDVFERAESMPCTPHIADCFSVQPHPSRAHRAGTLPSRVSDVRGDLQRHAAGCRGPKGGVGMVLVVEAGWGREGGNWCMDLSHFGSYMGSAEFAAAIERCWFLWAYILNCFVFVHLCVCVCVWVFYKACFST